MRIKLGRRSTYRCQILYMSREWGPTVHGVLEAAKWLKVKTTSGQIQDGEQ